MTATTSPPPAVPFHYVVISPFLGYARGDVITEAGAIALVEKDHLPHVVRIRAGA
jgi:hypothetical protein